MESAGASRRRSSHVRGGTKKLKRHCAGEVRSAPLFIGRVARPRPPASLHGATGRWLGAQSTPRRATFSWPRLYGSECSRMFTVTTAFDGGGSASVAEGRRQLTCSFARCSMKALEHRTGGVGQRNPERSSPQGICSRDGLLSSNSHRASSAATAAPVSCAAMKSGTSRGAIPANVSERLRATVIAGLAKLVEEVNQ